MCCLLCPICCLHTQVTQSSSALVKRLMAGDASGDAQIQSEEQLMGAWRSLYVDHAAADTSILIRCMLCVMRVVGMVRYGI